MDFKKHCSSSQSVLILSKVNKLFYYPGLETDVAKYCTKVTTNSSKYKAVYLKQNQVKNRK